MKDVDDGYMTQDYGVEVGFDQSIHASHHDQNLIQGMLGYLEKIQVIIEADLSLFQCVIFRCQWWDTFDRNNVKEDHDCGMISINSRKMWHEPREPYVFPKHCSQVFFTQMCWIGIGGLY